MSQYHRLQRIIDLLTSVSTVAVAAGLIWTLAEPRRAGQMSTAAQVTRSPVTLIDGIETSLDIPVKHRDSAKIAIIEFSDFECPFCGRYAREIYPQVQANLVDKGIANYSFRHFPLESIHKSAFRAGEASACAGEQGKFWEMHDHLFQNQKPLADSDLFAYAQALRLDESAFRVCLREQMAGKIKSDQEEARKFGINSTPSFLVGTIQKNGKVKVLRKMSGAQPYEVFKSLVDEVLKAA